MFTFIEGDVVCSSCGCDQGFCIENEDVICCHKISKYKQTLAIPNQYFHGQE